MRIERHEARVEGALLRSRQRAGLEGEVVPEDAERSLPAGLERDLFVDQLARVGVAVGAQRKLVVTGRPEIRDLPVVRLVAARATERRGPHESRRLEEV